MNKDGPSVDQDDKEVYAKEQQCGPTPTAKQVYFSKASSLGGRYKVDSLRTVIGLQGGLYTTRTWSVHRFELCTKRSVHE